MIFIVTKTLKCEGLTGVDQPQSFKIPFIDYSFEIDRLNYIKGTLGLSILNISKILF